MTTYIFKLLLEPGCRHKINQISLFQMTEQLEGWIPSVTILYLHTYKSNAVCNHQHSISMLRKIYAKLRKTDILTEDCLQNVRIKGSLVWVGFLDNFQTCHGAWQVALCFVDHADRFLNNELRFTKEFPDHFKHH